MYTEYKSSYLVHYGIRGQRWGDRKYQNIDGTLTPEGRARYGIGPGRSGNISAQSLYKKNNSSQVTINKKQKFKFFDTSKERGNYLIDQANKKHQGDSYQKQVNRARRKIILKRFGSVLLPDIGATVASKAINLAGNYAMYKTNGKFKWTRERQAVVNRSIKMISAIQNSYQVAKGVQEMRAVNRASPIKIKKKTKKKG